MARTTLKTLLAGYTSRRLPDLGAGSRSAPHAPLRVRHALQNALEEKTARDAFAALVLRWADAADLLVRVGRNGVARVPGGGEVVEFADEREVREVLGVGEDEQVFTVAFYAGDDEREWTADTLALHLRADALELVSDTHLLSEASARTFLAQLAFALQPSTTPAPEALLSIAPQTYAAARAHPVPLHLSRTAAAHPDWTAHEIYPDGDFDAPPQILTYSALNARANAVAAWLARAIGLGGEGEQKRVCVCRQRDAWFYVLQAAIWKAGAVYVSIDTDLPPARKAYIAADAGAALVLTTRAEADVLSSELERSPNPNFTARVVVPEETLTDAELGDARAAEETCAATLDGVAYLLYTSGTTGTPKGCLLTHRGLFWAIDAMVALPLPLTEPGRDKRLALASTAFDVHISEIAQAWALGIALLSAPRLAVLAQLARVLVEKRVTHVGIVPSMLRACVPGGPESIVVEENGKRRCVVKYLVSGGEKISDEVLAAWAGREDVLLANFYGPTEATVGCTSRVVNFDDKKENIGRPFPSCAAYVALPAPSPTTPASASPLSALAYVPAPDVPLSLAPRGTPGELVVTGPLVGVGYHNLPGATARAFLSWPSPGERAYRTGDLVRMMPDGTLEILGRIDAQIKLRGVRIEADGVSAVLAAGAKAGLGGEKHGAAALVCTHPALGAAEHLVGFIAPSKSTSAITPGAKPALLDTPRARAAVRAARKEAERELARYMRPSYVLCLAALPLSMNGKTDNKALAALFAETDVGVLMALQSGEAPAEAREEAMSAREREVARVVGEVLGKEGVRVGRRTSLFELGLDSLGFARLARRLGALGAGEIMARPTVADIADMLASSSTAKAKARRSLMDEGAPRGLKRAREVFDPEAIECVLPPFPVQQGVLAAIGDGEGEREDGGMYVQHFAYELGVGVGVERLRAAWGRVVERQEILRTVFVSDDEGLLQVVLKASATPLPFTTAPLPPSSSSDSATWFPPAEAARIARSINADAGAPRWRVHVYNDSKMVLSLSHALYDGGAIAPLMRDLDAALSYPSTSTTPPPASASLSSVLAHIAQPDPAFWRGAFEGVPEPAHALRRPSAGSEAKRVVRAFESAYGRIREGAGRESATVQALLEAAFALAARGVCGWDEWAVFGTVRAGRALQAPQIDGAVMPLVSLLPTPLRLAPGDPARMVRAAQAHVRASLPHEHAALGQILRWVGRRAGVEAVFSVRYAERNAGEYAGFRHVFSSAAPPEFVLAVEVVIDVLADSVEARAAYSSADLGEDEVAGVLEALEAVVEAILRGSSAGSAAAYRTRVQHEQAEGGDGGDADAPADPEVVKALARSVAAFLKIGENAVGPRTSFAALGLSSLQAVALAKRMSDEGVKATAVEIMQADCVERLARAVSRAGVGGSEEGREAEKWVEELKEKVCGEVKEGDVRLGEDDQVVVLPCTALQSGMLSQTINSSGELYVHAFTLRLSPSCTAQRIKQAWHRTVATTPTLRTSFHFASSAGRWAQAIHSVADFKWSEERRKELGAAAKETIESLSFAKEDDFARPPVYLRHVVTDEGDYVVLVMHHALYDGIAVPLLLQRVKQMYDADDKRDVEHELGFDKLADAILHQEHAGTKFWLARLADAPPFRFPRASSSSTGAWRASREIDVSKVEVARVCRRYGVHAQCVGQAAWARVLATVSSRADVVFGQVVSGRVLAGARDFIGPVFNTIPVRLTIARGQTNRELLQRAHKLNVEALPYQHASLRTVQRALGVQSVCDTLFLFQPGLEIGEQDGREQLWEMVKRGDVEKTKTQYAVNIELHETSAGYSVFASCAADAMDRASLIELLDALNDAVREIVRTPNSLALPETFDFASATTSASSSSASSPSTPATPLSEELWTPQDHKLVATLRDFLALPASAVSSHTHLAAIGVDSISAIQLASLARKAGLPLLASDVARSVTVLDLMRIIADKSEGASKATTARLLPRQQDEDFVRATLDALPEDIRARVTDVLPAAPGMEFYAGEWQRNSGKRFHHAFAYRLAAGVNLPAVQKAWNEVLRRSPILRSIFVPSAEGRRMAVVVLDNYDSTVEVVSGEVASAAKALTRRRVEAYEPFSKMVFVQGEEVNHIVLGMHHVQYDAWSLPLLVQDLRHVITGQAPTSDPSLRAFLSSFDRSESTLSVQRTYWQSLFGTSFTPHLLPRALPFPSPRTYAIIREGFPSITALQKKANAHGLTITAVLVAAWARVQAQLAGNADVAFGMWVARRGHEFVDEDGASHATEQLSVPTVNALPYRLSDTQALIPEIARAWMKQAQARDEVIECSRMKDISACVGQEGKPVCDVWLNVVKSRMGRDVEESDGEADVLRSVMLRRAPAAERSGDDLLPHTWRGDLHYPEIKDSLAVELIYNTVQDRISMIIECDGCVLDEEGARRVASKWGRELGDYCALLS